MAGTPKWIVVAMRYEPHISAVSCFLNLFHLVVLCQKPMRTTSSINVIMIGIAVCHLYSMGYPVVGKIRSVVSSFTNPCDIPDPYLSVVLNWIAFSLRDDVRRCVIHLGLGMAIVRVVVLRNPGNRSMISGAKFGWIVILGTLTFSTFISVFHLLRSTVKLFYEWTPYGKECIEKFPLNFTQPSYAILGSEMFQWNGAILSRIYLIFDGLVANMIPAALFPILSFVLIVIIRRAAENREKLFSDRKTERNNRTTKLVTYTTIFFMLGTLPLGVLYILQSSCDDSGCM